MSDMVAKRKRIESQPHVELLIPADDLDCEVIGLTPDGQQVTLSSVLISPFFYPGGAAPTVANILVRHPGGVVNQRLSLSMQPNTGRLKLTDRSQRIAPKFVKPIKPAGNGNGNGNGGATEKKAT